MSQLWSLELCSAGNEGESASGAVKGECFESALEFGGGVVAVCFCFGAGAGGQSALEFGGVVVGFFFSGGRGPVSFFRLACPTFDTCQEVCSVRQGFCQEAGSEEAGSARKESQLWSCVLSSFGGNGVKNWKLIDAT